MTLQQYFERLAEIHDKMWNTVEPEEIRKLEDEHIALVEEMLKDHY